MKKILVTTLALSLACASTIDARLLGGTPAASQRQMAMDVSNATADLKAAPRSEKSAAFQNLMDTLADDPKLADLARLEAERKKIVTDLEEENAKLKKIKTGWFFHSDEYKDQRDIVRKIGTQLKEKNKEIATVRKEYKDLSEESVAAVKSAVIAAVAAVGILTVLEYWYSGEGKAFGREGFTGTQVGRGVGAVRGYAETGYGMIDVPVVGSKARAERAAATKAATGK